MSVVASSVNVMEATGSVALDTPSGVLAAARRARAVADRAEAELLELAVSWVVMHPPESIVDVACLATSYGQTTLPVAGEGAPQVAEFAMAEFAAALGLGHEAGKRLLGQAVELRYRLPRVWARVQGGDLAAWKARRVAEDSIDLPSEAATFVDRHVAPVAHQVRPAQLRRLVDEARARACPLLAEDAYASGLDRRHVTVLDDQVSFGGTLRVEAELDLADALDFNAAVTRGAEQLKALGSTDDIDARRAAAVGVLARRQLAFEYDAAASAEGARPGFGGRPARQTVLHVHLSEAALHGADGCDELSVGRVEGHGLVTVDQIRAWCGTSGTTVVVKPVLDLAGHVRVDQGEVPDRIVEQVALRDGGCVFPWCGRSARRCRPDDHPCDCDHVVPHSEGGVTCPCNLAPLCRRHHRLKTHGSWSYLVLEPGRYLWRSPRGYRFLVDHTGTRDVTLDRVGEGVDGRPCPVPPDS